MKQIYLFLLFFCTIAQLSAQTVSNVRANFTDCHVEVEYDLETPRSVDLILKYSGDGGNTWIPCGTVSGDITNQGAGNNKLIIWDNQADNIHWGKITFQVEVPVFVGCPVKSTLPAGELIFMCYNLGADENLTIEQQMEHLSAGNTDATVYGDLYQWGRLADGHEKRTSGVINTLSANDEPLHDNFIRVQLGYLDWRSPQNSNLWRATKTPFDPCPEGWRVPTQEEWASIFDAASGNSWTWNSTGTPGLKISSDGDLTTSLFLPAAGNRHYYDGTTFNNVGANGYYWSSTTSASGAYGLYFTSSNRNPSYSMQRANGLSCRCVEE